MAGARYNPRNYGAYCDGVRDDALPLIICDSQAQQGPANAVIEIDGTYLLGRAVTVQSRVEVAPGGRINATVTPTFGALVTAWEPQGTVFPGVAPVLNGGYAVSGGIGGAASGDLSGNYPGPLTIVAGAVTAAKIAANTITAAKLAAAAATGAALGADVATLTGNQALTNKTLDGSSNAAVRLARVTLGAAGIITFGPALSLSQAYSHLVIVGMLRATQNTATQTLGVRFNNDVASGYDWQLLQANGVAAPTSLEGEAQGFITVGVIPGASAPAGVFGPVRIEIPNYSATNANKCLSGEASAKTGTGAGALFVQKGAGWYRSNAAITQIDLFPGVNSFDVGSMLELIAYP